MPQDVNMPIGENMPSQETVSSRSVSEIPNSPERIPGSSSEHEQARERAGEKYSEILTKVTPQVKISTVSGDDQTVASDAQAVFSEMDIEARVTRLLSLAETKGPEHAVKVAIKLNDFYVLDRMHDEMAEKFYDALVAKGVIKV
ncbi:MAG: hypothetical protein HGA31_01595 [Candidatus Moranbacteria bacterium]|nr:hypothetical protein [Candidatus Moranbacteria bacterium]